MQGRVSQELLCVRTASALTCRARPGGEDGNLQPRPREPWERSHLAVSWVPGAHAVTSLAPKGHRTSPPASSPALHVPQGLLGESPRSLLVGGQGCVLPPAVNPVHRPFAGKLRSPFLQRQLPQPESPLGGERAHAASRPSAGKALGHPAGWGGRRGVLSLPRVRAGCTALAGVCEEPAPSAPACPVPVEEEAVYEEPPDQETLYEEPPVVGSLQLGQGCEGLGPETASPATPGRLTALFKFGAACAISCVACAAAWEVLGGEHCEVPEARPWAQPREPGPDFLPVHAGGAAGHWLCAPGPRPRAEREGALCPGPVRLPGRYRANPPRPQAPRGSPRGVRIKEGARSRPLCGCWQLLIHNVTPCPASWVWLSGGSEVASGAGRCVGGSAVSALGWDGPRARPQGEVCGERPPAQCLDGWLVPGPGAPRAASGSPPFSG